MLRCPACLSFEYRNYDHLSDHFLEMEKISNPEHIMWLNRYISMKKVPQAELMKMLEGFFGPLK